MKSLVLEVVSNDAPGNGSDATIRELVAGQRTIQTISASGSSIIPYSNFSTQFPKAVSKAFADFSQKLNAAR